MLRKESMTFLEVYEKTNLSKAEKEQQEKFKKRNQSQIVNRIVKQTNNAIEEIAFVLENLPIRYREKIKIEQGFDLFNDRINKSYDKNAKLRIARKQLETGIKSIKEEIKGDELLKTIFEQKLDEVENLVKLLVKSKTRLVKKQQIKTIRPNEEYSFADYASAQKRK